MPKAILTGGRDYQWSLLDLLWVLKQVETRGITEICHGACATGADQIVARPACGAFLQRQTTPPVRITPFPADWYPGGLLDRAAGPKRNSAMVAYCQPGDVCLEFPGGAGTADTVRKAQARGLVMVPYQCAECGRGPCVCDEEWQQQRNTR